MAANYPKSVFGKANTQVVHNASPYQDYHVICKVIEAKLEEDLSTFFSNMNVYCEIKFTSEKSETKHTTKTVSGQNPTWAEIFTFNYRRMTKHGLKQNRQKDVPVQQLDFCLYKKTMLFTSDKIGETTVQLHNSSSGSQTDWLILLNDKEEVVGKVLAYIEIKKDNTSKQIQQI